MSDILELVPKDKFDLSSIERLKHLEEEQAQMILGDLLVWIQDMNWPVARELIRVLPKFHRQLLPHIQAVLRSDDDIWKNSVLELLWDFPAETVAFLSEDIKRMADCPTKAEILEETNVYAQEIVKQFHL